MGVWVLGWDGVGWVGWPQVTSAKKAAGTDARVWVQLFGMSGVCSDFVELMDWAANETVFSRGSTHTFKCTALDVGPLHKIRLQHKSVTEGSRWHLSHVDVKRMNIQKAVDSSEQPLDNLQEYKFGCDRWVHDADGVDECYSVELVLGGQSASIPYLVTVVTSDCKGAGTDAQVREAKRL